MGFINDIKQRIRGNLKLKALHPYGVGWFVDTKQGMFVVDPRDQIISRKLIKKGAYETGTITCLSKLIDHESVVLFIGAHIGTLLVPLAKIAKHIYAWEADKYNYKLLKYNTIINGLNNVDVFNFAVGDKDNISIIMKHDMLNSGHSSISFGSGDESNSIEMVTIDRNLEAGTKVRLIVMDIEGAEVHAIRGMANTLKNTDILYTEFSNKFIANLGETCKSFAELLSDHFSCAKIFDESGSVFYDRKWVDYLASYDSKDEEIVMDIIFTRDPSIIKCLQFE